MDVDVYIADEVQYLKKFYERKMLETKRIYFKFLNKEKKLEEFKKELNRIWGNIDHTFMNDRIKKLQKIVSNKNFKDFEKYVGKEFTNEVKMDFETRKNQNYQVEEFYKLNKEKEFEKVEQKYIKNHAIMYKNNLETIKKVADKQIYLAKLVNKYDQLEATIPYFNKDGTIRCYNTVSTYNSMLYNVNLTRSAWNTTQADSILLENDRWIIYPHMYSCPSCMYHQGKVYTTEKKEQAIEDGVGHPNCKCVWYLYWDESQLDYNTYANSGWEEAYYTRQKLQSLNLQRYRLKNDKKIQQDLENQKEVDELQKKISKINSAIRELKVQLPTNADKVMQGLSTRQ